MHGNLTLCRSVGKAAKIHAKFVSTVCFDFVHQRRLSGIRRWSFRERDYQERVNHIISPQTAASLRTPPVCRAVIAEADAIRAKLTKSVDLKAEACTE